MSIILSASKKRESLAHHRVAALARGHLHSSWRTIAEYEWRISQSVLEPLMGHKMEGVAGKHYLRPDLDMLLRAFADDYFANNRTV